MHYTLKPRGVCSRQIDLDVENGIVRNLHYTGGCDGNLQAISILAEGMRADDLITRLRGIKCGFKGTSCTDQLSRTLEKAMKEHA